MPNRNDAWLADVIHPRSSLPSQEGQATCYRWLGNLRVAYRGGEVVEIRPGDVVYIEPNEEHWHGATTDRFMAHVAMHEADDQGQVVTWLQHVSDEEYRATS